VGVWGWGFGVGGLAPTPQSPIPNPQSPIPISKKEYYLKYINIMYINFSNEFIFIIFMKFLNNARKRNGY
jgi:hypothetical protein